MRLLLTIFIVCRFCNGLYGIDHLPSQYLVIYGSTDAPIKIFEYFSFLCPHCINLYKNDFKQIKEDFIDTGKVQFIFHPYPRDLTTTQAMICLSKLDNLDKQIFLETLFEQINFDNPEAIAKFMIASMELLNHPTPQLDSPEFFKKQEALIDCLKFLRQEERVTAIPSPEINGIYYPDDLPDHQFISKALERKL